MPGMRVIQTFQDFSSAEMLCRRGGLEGEDQPSPLHPGLLRRTVTQSASGWPAGGQRGMGTADHFVAGMGMPTSVLFSTKL